MKDYYFVVFFMLAAVFGFLVYEFVFTSHSNIKTATATVGGHSFLVEIADNASKQMQGLSGREKLNENEGMLFIFKDAAIRSFWMKGMKFPIDIIWIKNGEVVELSESLQPSGSMLNAFKESVAPSIPVDSVLEVSSGTVERMNIKVGDRISVNSNS